ncbi:tetratricopeptide (TPR) repeat protein [Kribbella aluminosa]|uniref:Tetratricopeptide (TPR) repeat protein n=1 Tax=Kribbella aluminosa TaxID=416017 RepID=A0ABS4UIK3_9ACTN|nr:SEC-C metal-binding domain-containing protein [Kribbella aluminosa]MBP2351486.1 tetratricopeptide (TPR) repeat protein [Kribbella aluminosa]
MDDPLADELRNHWMDTKLGRAFALLIIANEHASMGRPERAVAIWQQLISEGGTAGDNARVDHADFLFEAGRESEARSELDAVMTNGRIYNSAWCFAAEMLERRGELDEALFWYEIAAGEMTADDVTSTYRVRDLVSGRRRVKWKLGLPLDGIDLLGEQGDDEALDREADLHELLRLPKVCAGRIEAWDLSEFDDSVRWRTYFIGGSADRYCRMVEAELRAHGARATIATWTYNGLLDCLRDVRIKHDDLPDGRRVQWPPPRNQPCWCGSGVKYKKCCGGPLPAAEPMPAGPQLNRYGGAHGG